ncbi:LOW QUALITY PROTEIN: receptor-like protein 33 [Actinidia eriantha]|uniref:LOW QUALITY PROTEIN: receptor-like protein 33 n=1 Tax=Actinidia eriantha TaxID=165200 RepID=UPI00258CF7AE|nr:LOW QUALITY PROTEIN: receptor-like protein 33 [Actinidia eriantha]
MQCHKPSCTLFWKGRFQNPWPIVQSSVFNLCNNSINDTFPCFLKKSSTLRVLILRSNKFQGDVQCQGVHKNSWTELQIIDVALNFSGVLPPKFFLNWKAMMIYVRKSNLNQQRFEFWKPNHFYYQDTVTVTNKGLQMELLKILTIFTSIDFSCNNFQGEIPDTVKALESLYVLNLSHNALTGRIPSSLGNMTQLRSLYLSQNKLSGNIPVQLASLTFLSCLNLSYNHLVGTIPNGSQFHTFSDTRIVWNSFNRYLQGS